MSPDDRRSAAPLNRLQQHFADAMLDRHLTGALLAEVQPVGAMEDRIALYRGNLTAIWKGALGNAYPVLAQLVGETFFTQMARAYGQARPSQCGDLNSFGAELPAFLREQPDLMTQYAYFADVADLEWSLHSAYYAEDAPSFSLQQMLQFAAQQGREPGVLTLQLAPAARLLRSSWNSLEIWQAHQPQHRGEFPPVCSQQSFLIVARSQWFPLPFSVSEASWLALQALQDGQTLGAALELALEKESGFDPVQHLSDWFAHGVFSGVAC